MNCAPITRSSRKGRELVATVMFEIDDPVRRTNFLDRLGGVEHTAFLKFDGETVKGVPEEDQDRTNEQGKASSVQFIHFPLDRCAGGGVQAGGRSRSSSASIMPRPMRPYVR